MKMFRANPSKRRRKSRFGCVSVCLWCHEMACLRHNFITASVLVTGMMINPVKLLTAAK